jgi:hypothetical protein
MLPSTPSSSEWSLLCRFSDQSFVCVSHLPPACYMPRSSGGTWDVACTGPWNENCVVNCLHLLCLREI